MTLLAVVLALFAEHFLLQFETLRARKVQLRYYLGIQPRITKLKFLDNELGVLLILSPTFIVIALLAYWLSGLLLGLPLLLFGAVVLWFSMGPSNLYQQVRRYLDAIDSDDQDAVAKAEQELDLPKADRHTNIEHRLTNAILVESNNEIFSTVFWFVILGPAGAAVTRLINVVEEQAIGSARFQIAVLRVSGFVSWAPARLQVAGYAVAGSLTDVGTAWRKVMKRDDGSLQEVNERLLLATGHAALKEDVEDRKSTGLVWVESAMLLVRRTAIVWVAAVAILTLANIVR